jgi:hypothetical protein
MLKETEVKFKDYKKIKGDVIFKRGVDRFDKLSPGTYGVELEFSIPDREFLVDVLSNESNIEQMDTKDLRWKILSDWDGTLQELAQELNSLAYNDYIQRKDVHEVLYYMYEMVYYGDSEYGAGRGGAYPMIKDPEDIYDLWMEVSDDVSKKGGASEDRNKQLVEARNFIKYLEGSNLSNNGDILDIIDRGGIIHLIRQLGVDTSSIDPFEKDSKEILNLILTAMPISNVGIDVVGYSNWDIGWDYENIEIRSPISRVGNYDELVEVMEFIERGVEELGIFSVHGETSAHVHIGVGQYKKDYTLFDICAVNSLVDQKAIQFFEGEGRNFSRFAKLGSGIMAGISNSGEGLFELDTYLSEDEFERKIISNMPIKYQGVNLSHTLHSIPTIEFRYLSSRSIYNIKEFLQWIEYFDLLIKVAKRKNRVYIKPNSPEQTPLYLHRASGGIVLSKERKASLIKNAFTSNEPKIPFSAAAIMYAGLYSTAYKKMDKEKRWNEIEKFRTEFFKLDNTSQNFALKVLQDRKNKS